MLNNTETTMATYRIKNINGKAGGIWSREFATRDQAAEAIRASYSWDEVVLSSSYDSDEGPRNEDGDRAMTRCWNAYETQEECARDDDGAHAHARIIEVRDRQATKGHATC